jgi:hypothetical protein
VWLLMGLSFFSSLLFGYGKTWKGYELEWLVNQAGTRIGPFHINAGFSLGDAGYDSNVYRMPDASVKDYSFTGGPALTLYLPINKKIILTVYESPQYVYFLETKRERTWNNTLNGRIQFALNRFFVSAEAGVTVAREIWSSEIDIRPRLKSASALGLVLWQPTQKTSFSLEARESRFRYEDLSYREVDLPDVLNHRERYLNAAAYYQLSYRFRVRLEAESGRFVFDNSANPRNSRSQSVFAGIDFGKGGTWEGRIRIGYKYFFAPGAGGLDYHGLVGDTSVGVRLGTTLRVRASYIRDVRFSIWPGYVYFVENRAGAGVSFYLSRNVRLDCDTGSGEYRYPRRSSGPAPGLGEMRNDRIQTRQFGVFWRLRRNIGLGLKANWWRRNSTEAWLRSERIFVGASLIYDF